MTRTRSSMRSTTCLRALLTPTEFSRNINSNAHNTQIVTADFWTLGHRRGAIKISPSSLRGGGSRAREKGMKRGRGVEGRGVRFPVLNHSLTGGCLIHFVLRDDQETRAKEKPRMNTWALLNFRSMYVPLGKLTMFFP